MITFQLVPCTKGKKEMPFRSSNGRMINRGVAAINTCVPFTFRPHDRQRGPRSVNVVGKREGEGWLATLRSLMATWKAGSMRGDGRTIVTDTKPETSSDTRWELESRMRFFSRVKARRLPSARFCDTSTSRSQPWSSLDRSSITRISALGGSMESG